MPAPDAAELLSQSETTMLSAKSSTRMPSAEPTLDGWLLRKLDSPKISMEMIITGIRITATSILLNPLSLRLGMKGIFVSDGMGSPQWAQFCQPEAMGFPQLAHLAFKAVPQFGQEEYSS